MGGVDQGFKFLAGAGLNLAAVFNRDTLPPDVKQSLRALPAADAKLPQLILLGAAGRGLWHAMGGVGEGAAENFSVHPVDQYSTEVAKRFIAQYLGAPRVCFLYPGDFPLPLQQLGAALGWSHPSPLGLHIHPEFGLWFAWRAAFLAATALPATPPGETTGSPCANCADKPCITACPVNAVHATKPFAIKTCAVHRLSAASPSCRSTCHARLACPVGAKYRYSAEQFAYHSRRALGSLS